MRKRNIGKKILCGAMAACMCVAFVPAQAFASGSGRYVSAIHMAYGKDGAQKLENAGYTVVTDENGNAADVNQDTGEEYVYLGYETTTDASEALTDIAVLNMNDGFSLAAYKEKLEADKTSATAKAYEFQSIIKEFRARYKANTAYGKSVVALMNNYIEDKSGLGMGDFLLDESKCTEDALSTVMLESNNDNFVIIEQLLSKALATDFASNIAGLEMDGDYSDVEEADAQAVMDQCINLRTKLKAYEKNDYQVDVSDADALQDSLDEINEADLTDEDETEDAVDAYEYGSVYEAFKDIEYGDSGDTLLDLAMTNPKNIDSTDNYKPLASLLTSGQITLMGVVGLSELVLDSIEYKASSNGATLKALQSEAEDAINDMVEETVEEGDVDAEDVATTVSMYEGVNMDLFTSDNVALTSDALRTQNTHKDASMFWNNDMSKAFYVIGGFFACATAILYFVQRAAWLDAEGTIQTILSQTFGADVPKAFQELSVAQEYAMAEATASAKALTIACGVVAVITAVIELWAIGKDIYSYYHPTYLEIPDVIVDQVDTNNSDGTITSYFVDYAVVKDLDGKAGDANGWGGKSWNAIYTSTKKTAGDPITADSLVVRINNNAAPTTDAVGVHAFGETTAAYDLNSHVYEDVFSGGDKDEIYMFFERDENAYTASAFANGYMFLAAGVGLLVGIAGTLAVSSAARKRRKEAPATA